jgi:predicted metal-dependent phosphoesterase TrpH
VIVDLHLHSMVSDGDQDPCALLGQAARLGVTHASIADHDALGAYSWESGRVFAEARRLGVELTPGIELDAELDGLEVHLLGYGVSHAGDSPLARHIGATQAARGERARKEIEIVRQLLGADSVRATDVFIEGRQTLMKPHFIHPLLDKGLFPTYQAANAWYKQNVRSGIEVAKPPLERAIALVHSAGGWTVLAHPAYYEKGGVPVVTRLAELAALGLDGVELEYPYEIGSPGQFTRAEREEYTARLREAATGLGLRMTRGSDGHTLTDLRRVYGPAGGAA